jgi:GAF domain-containing protein
VVGVPLLWDDNVIGLLFVADRYHRTHTAQNVSILSTLATHAAVAIKNAMAFAQAARRWPTRRPRAPSWSGMRATCRPRPRRTSS